MASTRNEPNRTGMTPERWQYVKSQLAAVLDLDADARPAYLDTICADDPSLRSELETLLESATESDSAFLDAPLFAEPSSPKRVGRRIGPYQVVEEIGEGGMGEVYRAFRADDHYTKQVAIKLVRAGQDSGFVISRFKNERQVLASLDHPNIARLLDGGTTEDGIPYFVMELIEGQPIHRYCDEHRLSVTQRIELFLQVCSAVQYAHQRLIIHRDLKPNNILVTTDGIPILLDFGIAKILDPRAAVTESTVSMFRLLTPAYASPEQIKGEPITSTSDVYSLGVLLYELLTGRWPYRTSNRGPHEIAEAVCEFEPERPSSSVLRTPEREENPRDEYLAKYLATLSPSRLNKRLRGDLDNIILMALRKEPQRRYASVEQFSTDLRRHLDDLPVIASRDTMRYRVAKFTRRHKAGVAAAAAVVATLLAGMAVTLHEARVARAQERRAEQRFNEVRELANSLLFDVHDSIQDLPGSTPARKLLVERALRYLDGLSRDAASDASLQRELATAYEKVGTVQGNPFGANLGDTQGALESYRKALSIRETIANSNSENAADQVALARSRRMLSAITSNRVGSKSANIMAGELHALATAERAYRLAPSDPQVLEELQANYDFLVTLRHYAGDYQGAWDYLQKERPIVEARLRGAPTDRSLQIAMGKLEVKSGDELAKLGFRKEGQEHARQSVQLFQSLSARETDALSKRYLAYAFERFGDSLLMDGDTRHALEVYRDSLEVLKSLLASDPNNALAQMDLGTETAKIGNALALSGQTKDGLEMLERARKMFEVQLKRDPSYTEPMWSLAWTQLWEADVLSQTGNPTEALKNYRTVLSIWEHQDQDILRAIVAEIHIKMGAVLAKTKTAKTDQAAQEYRTALSTAQTVIAQSPFVLEAQYAEAQSYSGLGKLSRTLAEGPNRSPQEFAKDWTEARTWYQQSEEAWQKIHNPGAMTPAGFARDRSDKIEDQLSDCDAALAKLTNNPPLTAGTGR